MTWLKRPSGKLCRHELNPGYQKMQENSSVAERILASFLLSPSDIPVTRCSLEPARPEYYYKLIKYGGPYLGVARLLVTARLLGVVTPWRHFHSARVLQFSRQWY